MKPQMRCKSISFSSDGYSLRGTLHLPPVDRPGVVIGSHGLLSSRASRKQRILARRCAEAGMAYFRFDHRGCGSSQGYFPEVTSLAERVQDLLSAVRCIRSRRETSGCVGLFGSSMGGATCLSAARSIGPEAIITLAAPLRSSSVHHQHDPVDPRINDLISNTSRRIRFDISDSAEGLRNVLLFHGDQDDVVPFSDGEELYDRTAKPNRFIRLRGGDHSLNDESLLEIFLQESLQWFQKRLVA